MHSGRWWLPNFLLTKTRSVRFKVDELAAIMAIIETNIACITEIWLNDNVETVAIDVDSFATDVTERMGVGLVALPAMSTSTSQASASVR
jgi:hypothetical protein